MKTTTITCDRCKKQLSMGEQSYRLTAGNEEYAVLTGYDICGACLRAFGQFIGASTHHPFGEQVFPYGPLVDTGAGYINLGPPNPGTGGES